jgi:hypothetical protein
MIAAIGKLNISPMLMFIVRKLSDFSIGVSRAKQAMPSYISFAIL